MLPLRSRQGLSVFSSPRKLCFNCQWRLQQRPLRYASTVQPAKQPISLRPYIYATVLLALGLIAGYTSTAIIRPPAFPEAGSEADKKLLSQLTQSIDNLAIVRSLRSGTSKSDDGSQKDTAIMAQVADELSSASAMSGGDDVWIELPVTYESSNTLVALMAGMRGLGVQRAFWHPSSKELVMIVWFGGDLTGWPGITHGGSTATVCIEGMKKAVACVQGTRNSDTPDPSSLSLTYLRPIASNSLYVLRAQVTEEEPSPHTALPPYKDLTKKHHKEKSGITARLNKKYEVNGSIESLDGKVCQKAKAIWDII